MLNFAILAKHDKLVENWIRRVESVSHSAVLKYKYSPAACQELNEHMQRFKTSPRLVSRLDFGAKDAIVIACPDLAMQNRPAGSSSLLTD
jgi:hypothetical protein